MDSIALLSLSDEEHCEMATAAEQSGLHIDERVFAVEHMAWKLVASGEPDSVTSFLEHAQEINKRYGGELM